MKIHQKHVAHLELKLWGMTVRSRQFPLSNEDAAKIDRQILQMEEKGLVEKSEDTTFNSPIFFIKNHTGKTRFVVDLRKVNDILKPMIVMLHRIDVSSKKIWVEKQFADVINDVIIADVISRATSGSGRATSGFGRSRHFPKLLVLRDVFNPNHNHFRSPYFRFRSLYFRLRCFSSSFVPYRK